MYSANTLDLEAAEAAPMPADAAAVTDDGGGLVIAGRFGALEIARKSILDFPRGLLGFGDFRSFGIADLSDPSYAEFKVLQCLNDHWLAFLVLPLDPDAGFIDRADLNIACDSLLVEIDNLVIMLVVTVRKVESGADITVNLRAPLLIDSTTRVGNQYVMRSDRYPVRCKI